MAPVGRSGVYRAPGKTTATACRFSWLRPEQRPELWEAAAIDRMRRDDLAARLTALLAGT